MSHLKSCQRWTKKVFIESPKSIIFLAEGLQNNLLDLPAIISCIERNYNRSDNPSVFKEVETIVGEYTIKLKEMQLHNTPCTPQEESVPTMRNSSEGTREHGGHGVIFQGNNSYTIESSNYHKTSHFLRS